MEPSKAPGPVNIEAKSPPPGAEKGVEDRLFKAMDSAAMHLLETLEDRSKDDKGNDKVDMNTRIRVFTLAQDWLLKRQKAKPDDPSNDDEGVQILRQMMDDPARVVGRLKENPIFVGALIKAGWLPPLGKKSGRPTQAEAAARRVWEQEKDKRLEPVRHDADDGDLQAALRGNPQ